MGTPSDLLLRTGCIVGALSAQPWTWELPTEPGPSSVAPSATLGSSRGGDVRSFLKVLPESGFVLLTTQTAHLDLCGGVGDSRTDQSFAERVRLRYLVVQG